MINVFGMDAEFVAQLGINSVQPAQVWSEYIGAAATASVNVVCRRALDDAGVAMLRELKQSSACAPIILVTNGDSANAKLLCSVDVDCIVWHHEIARGLPQAIGQAAQASPQERLLSVIVTAQTIPPQLRDALVVAATVNPPFHTVKRWSLTLGRSPRSLQKLCRSRGTGSPTPLTYLRLIRRIREAPWGNSSDPKQFAKVLSIHDP